MSELDELSTLKLLGLKSYEAQCYMTLLSSFGMTAREIAETSKVPRVKTYEVLDSLYQYGWITKDQSRPAIFTAFPPEKHLFKKSNNLINNLKDSVSNLQNMWENKTMSFNEPMEHFQSTNRLKLLTNSLIQSSQNRIFFLIRYLLEDEAPLIFNELAKKLKDGVQVTVIVHPEILDEEDVKTELKKLRELSEIRIASIPTRLLIIDSTSIILSTPAIEMKNNMPIHHSMLIRIPGLVTIIEQSVRASMTALSKKF